MGHFRRFPAIPGLDFCTLRCRIPKCWVEIPTHSIVSLFGSRSSQSSASSPASPTCGFNLFRHGSRYTDRSLSPLRDVRPMRCSVSTVKSWWDNTASSFQARFLGFFKQRKHRWHPKDNVPPRCLCFSEIRGVIGDNWICFIMKV